MKFPVVLTAALLCLSCLVVVSQEPTVPANGLVITNDHERGIQLYREGKTAAAGDYFKALTQKNSGDEVSWYYLGLAYYKQEKFKDSSNAFQRAIKLKPDFAAAHSNLSYSLLSRNKMRDAVYEAEIAQRLDSTISDAYYVIGVVRLRTGLPDEALSESKKALALNPKLAPAHLLKSLALLNKYARRHAAGRIVRRPPPSSAPTPEELARRRQLRVDEAALLRESAESLETYLELYPTAPDATTWRAQIETMRALSTIAQPHKEPLDSDAIWAADEVTVKARVLSKPEPAYTDSARSAGVSGVVILRAIFAADGTVRHILILAGLPNGLTEAAVNAARRIKFAPARVNDIPVSMAIQLEYNFNFY